MMETGEILMELTELARRKPEIRKALLEISAGEDYYAAMRRSTNGGGENSPMLEGEDDYYELFLSDLRQIGK